MSSATPGPVVVGVHGCESSAGASVLEISYPVPCTARTVAWRRTALMLPAASGVGAYDLPELFFDRVNE